MTQIVNKLDCSVCKKTQPSDVAIVAGSGFNICSQCVDLIEETDPLSKWAHGICMFCGQVNSERRSMVPGSDYAFCPPCTKLIRAMTGKSKESKAMSAHCTFCQNAQPLALFAGFDNGVAVCGECMQLCKELGSDADIPKDVSCVFCGKDRRYGKILSHEQLRICQRCIDGSMHTKAPSPNLKPLAQTLLPKSTPPEAPQPVPSGPPDLDQGTLHKLVDKVERIESRLARMQEVEHTTPRAERVASLDKVMPDPEDLESIRKLVGSAPHAEFFSLTSRAKDELKTLLNQLDKQKGILGSVVIGHDGQLFASTFPYAHDAESIGISMLGLFMNTENFLRRMGQERVYQIVTQTKQGHVVIADFGGGLLVTIGDGSDSPIYRKLATPTRESSPTTNKPSARGPSPAAISALVNQSAEIASPSYSYERWQRKNGERIKDSIYNLQQSALTDAQNDLESKSDKENDDA